MEGATADLYLWVNCFNHEECPFQLDLHYLSRNALISTIVVFHTTGKFLERKHLWQVVFAVKGLHGFCGLWCRLYISCLIGLVMDQDIQTSCWFCFLQIGLVQSWCTCIEGKARLLNLSLRSAKVWKNMPEPVVWL